MSDFDTVTKGVIDGVYDSCKTHRRQLALRLGTRAACTAWREMRVNPWMKTATERPTDGRVAATDQPITV